MYPRSSTFTSSSPAARGGDRAGRAIQQFPSLPGLISLGLGAPTAVCDGKTIGASLRWSQAALSHLPVELWPQKDLVKNWHCAEVACLAPTAANLKLRHEQFPAPIHAMALHMTAEGHIDQQFARGSDVGLGSGGASSRRHRHPLLPCSSRTQERTKACLVILAN